jgi:hypothetical protein
LSVCLSVQRTAASGCLQRSLFAQLTELLPSAAAEEDAVYDLLFALLFDPLEAVSAAVGGQLLNASVAWCVWQKKIFWTHFRILLDAQIALIPSVSSAR